MIKVLNSKKYPAGNIDYWWYNLSSPDKWIRHDTQIELILNDELNRKMGAIGLKLDRDDWYDRIMNASRHQYKGRNIKDSCHKEAWKSTLPHLFRQDRRWSISGKNRIKLLQTKVEPIGVN